MCLAINSEWKSTKIILPQHTDHAGVMWHGSYINFLEEARIDALNQVGIKYSKLSKRGFEIPVVSLTIKYKTSFFHGEQVLLKSKFNMVNKIRLSCRTLFLKSNGDIGAEAKVGLVIVRKENDSIKLIRELPEQIKNILLLLEEGPKV
tara:strand:+ start:254 stop:697 length:444 start_codon:yes stop_codon:yes gene_type:complete